MPENNNKYLAALAVATKKNNAHQALDHYLENKLLKLLPRFENSPSIYQTSLKSLKHDRNAKKFLRLKLSHYYQSFSLIRFRTPFEAYLIHSLHQSYPNEKWHQYNKRKTIYLKQGLLFHGTPCSYTKIFKEGLKARATSKNIEAYISRVSGNLGISTSKKYSVAKNYALPHVRPDKGIVTQKFSCHGYIYVIGINGAESFTAIDIEKTLQARPHSKLNTFFSSSKDEVNIKGHVPSSSILGCYQISRSSNQKVWVKNEKANKNLSLVLKKQRRNNGIHSSKQTFFRAPLSAIKNITHQKTMA
jgi:hypothetical protein